MFDYSPISYYINYENRQELDIFFKLWDEYYELMDSKKFQELEKLIVSSGEGVTIFNHAAISNKPEVLNIFLKVSKNQEKIILLKAINLCCIWNRAGVVDYALEKLNPNRALIVEYLQKNYVQRKIASYYLPELEKKLIDIYNYACKETKTGFKAWLFLEAFDYYLTYGPKKKFDLSVFMKYKKNYDITFKYS